MTRRQYCPRCSMNDRPMKVTIIILTYFPFAAALVQAWIGSDVKCRLMNLMGTYHRPELWCVHATLLFASYVVGGISISDGRPVGGISMSDGRPARNFGYRASGRTSPALDDNCAATITTTRRTGSPTCQLNLKRTIERTP